MPYNLIMIGCSLGGLKALQTLLSGMPRNCNTPIIIERFKIISLSLNGVASVRIYCSADWTRQLQMQLPSPRTKRGC